MLKHRNLLINRFPDLKIIAVLLQKCFRIQLNYSIKHCAEPITIRFYKMIDNHITKLKFNNVF